MVFQNDILAGASGTAAGYTIDQSIRFNRDDSAYLTRTPSSASNRRTFTLSFWWKMCTIPSTTSGGYRIIQAGSTEFGWSDSNNNLYLLDGGTLFQTSQVFRDPSAWQHIVLAVDTTDATAGNRIKLYINGSEVTNFASGPSVSQNFDFDINNTVAQNIGKEGSNYIGAYVAEFYSVDGTQLDATSFGETNADGVWVPKAYAGTYGTNGFYITGSNSASLGEDFSGNNNDFTSSGLTASDQVSDSPTDNYGTFNPLTGVNSGSSVVTQADGNLQATQTANYVGTFGTLAANSGKYYFEYSYAADLNYGDGRLLGGVVCVETADHGYFRIDGGSFYYPDKITEGNYMVFHRNGQQSNTGTSTSAYNTNLSSSSATGGPESGPDVYMVAMDLDNNNLYWGKNGTWYGASSTSGSDYTDATPIAILAAHQGKYFAPAFYWSGAASGTTGVLNCGQDATFGGRYSSPAGDFYYTPPTGFSALSTANLPEPTIKDGSAYFQASLYTGNGTAIGSGGKSVTQDKNSTFQPDFVWIKERNGSADNALYDVVRGTTKDLASNNTNAETTETEGLTAFNAAGFTVGNLAKVNTSSDTYVAWQWLAANGTSSNTDGSITSTISENTTSGLSIVTYTGDGNDNATVGHGLGITPKTVVIFPRSNGDNRQVSNWETGVTAFTEDLKINAAEVANSSSNRVKGGSSTTFTLGTDPNVNGSGNTYLAYVWNEVAGFSKFATYTSNGSTDGPVVYCGFRPAVVFIRCTENGEYWHLYDSTRNTFNASNRYLFPSLADAEGTSGRDIDILSNGFKLRGTDGGINSATNRKYIAMCFAENPFGGNGVAPATAR